MVIAHEVVVFFEDGGGPELERAVSEPIDSLIVVVNIEADGDDIEGFDVEIISESFLWFRIDPPEGPNHPVEVHLPGASEGNSDVEEISPAHVQLVQEIVFIYADSHILLALVVICEFYVRRFPPILERLE